MKQLSELQKDFWNKYTSTLDSTPANPTIEVGVAGNLKIADELLALYLSGK